MHVVYLGLCLCSVSGPVAAVDAAKLQKIYAWFLRVLAVCLGPLCFVLLESELSLPGGEEYTQRKCAIRALAATGFTVPFLVPAAS